MIVQRKYNLPVLPTKEEREQELEDRLSRLEKIVTESLGGQNDSSE